MLLNILQCTGCPLTKNDLVPNVNSANTKRPGQSCVFSTIHGWADFSTIWLTAGCPGLRINPEPSSPTALQHEHQLVEAGLPNPAVCPFLASPWHLPTPPMPCGPAHSSPRQWREL